MIPTHLCSFIVASALCVTTALAGETFVALPRHVALSGGEARQTLLLQRVDTDHPDDLLGPVTAPIEFESADPEIAVLENGVLKPLKNGRTTLRAKAADGRQAEVAVTVTGMEHAAVWDFRNDVLPVLAKSGCNMGSCHGALAGKGGFRLSLRGYDPDSDCFNIVKQDRGRRIELTDPGRSLFLMKPTGAVPHRGGVRFEVDSPEYRILSGWIAAGAPAPRETDARVVKVEVHPERVLLNPTEDRKSVV